MSARKSNADGAAGRSALRLDQLPAEVIQACAVQLAAEDNYWRNPRGLTQAFLLPTVCRRFKEALEQPFWSKLEWDLVAGLWRALGQPGSPEDASAQRWLRVQGSSVTCVHGLTVLDMDAARLAAMLASLPALSELITSLRAYPGAAAAVIQAFLAGAACAIGRSPCLRILRLSIDLVPKLADQLPEALGQLLAEARTLEEVCLSFQACLADRPDWPATFGLAHLVAGLAGLSRLRALEFWANNVGMEGALPASVSRLAQLTCLRLSGLDGLRCEPGWARLPALARFELRDCVFARNGEAALPGMDALVALTSFGSWNCPGLRTLPATLWRLTQLRTLIYCGCARELAGVPRAVLPAAGMPGGGAPCFASLTRLILAGHKLASFPPGILAAMCLTNLRLSGCCFEQLPEGVSVLTGLEELHLERHSTSREEIGGALDAGALGSLAGFPRLRSLSFANCSVLFCSDFQAAAAHPRLGELMLRTSYPECGPSCAAFLGFVHALLQQGRARVLYLSDTVVRGAGRRKCHNFHAALEAVGYPSRVLRQMVHRGDDDSGLNDDDDDDDVGDDDDDAYAEEYSSDGEWAV